MLTVMVYFFCSAVLQQCSDIFGDKFNTTSVAAAVRALNEALGGLNVTGSKIIFTNGSLDPWHMVGITENINEEMPVIYMQGNMIVTGKRRIKSTKL